MRSWVKWLAPYVIVSGVVSFLFFFYRYMPVSGVESEL